MGEGRHVPRPERVVAMLTLALLNVFLVAAALAVVKLTPDRSLAVRPPTVANRAIVVAAAPALGPMSASAPVPSSGTTSPVGSGSTSGSTSTPAPVGPLDYAGLWEVSGTDARGSYNGTAAVVAVSHLDKIYKTLEGADIEALKNVSFEIGEGEFVTVVGPSGCGKTTLLKILAGILRRTSGDVRLRGRGVDGPSRDVGVVFQAPVLLPWRTVLQNVM